MEKLALQFFPFPHVFKGQRKDGLLVHWADPCFTCDRQCELSKSTQIELCSYGINYYRVDDDLLIAGVVVHDYPRSTPARRKALRKTKRNVVSTAAIEAIAHRAAESMAELEEQARREKDHILDEYRETEAYKHEVVELLRPSIEQALSQAHDYRSLITQIIQNFNVIMQTRFPGKELERQLEEASHEERAIYEAARLMENKIEAALFLMYPDRINAPSRRRRFRVHGQFTKYRKIYERAYEQKGLQLIVKGESHAEIRANPDAVGVIPHTFLDNALKYAPRGSNVTLDFEEDEDHIWFSVTSLGPKIEDREKRDIFDLFYRGRAAKEMEREGTGFGLALAEVVATQIGAQLSVSQEPHPETGPYYWTTFTVRLQR